jgi:hypothetical protein
MCAVPYHDKQLFFRIFLNRESEFENIGLDCPLLTELWTQTMIHTNTGDIMYKHII